MRVLWIFLLFFYSLERLFRRVWREVFAVLRVIVSFFVLFVSELLRFLLNSVVRTLVLDTIAALGDHLLKPLLTVLFNAVLQPLFALTWNVCNSAFQAVDPLVRLSGVLMSQVGEWLIHIHRTNWYCYRQCNIQIRYKGKSLLHSLHWIIFTFKWTWILLNNKMLSNLPCSG